MGPGQVPGSLKLPKAGIGIGQGIEKSSDFRNPIHDPLQKALRFFGMPCLIGFKDIPAILGKGHVNMQPISTLVREGFGHKGCKKPVLRRDIFDRCPEGDQIVRRLKGMGILKIDFVLPRPLFMVGAFRLNPHFL